jgi:hypothetical protein
VAEPTADATQPAERTGAPTATPTGAPNVTPNPVVKRPPPKTSIGLNDLPKDKKHLVIGLGIVAVLFFIPFGIPFGIAAYVIFDKEKKRIEAERSGGHPLHP